MYGVEIQNPDYEISKINIELDGIGKRWVDVTWLANIRAFDVKLPKHLQHKLFEIEFIEVDNQTRFDFIDHINGFKMVFKRPIYFDSAHRIVPGYPNLAVNNNGTSLINIQTGNHLSLADKNFGYNIAYCNNRTIRVHRLVALAWVKNKNPVTHHIVNHKNSIRDDNRYTNLEWCDIGGNNLHAVRSGAIPHSVAVRVRDYKTGDVTEFESINEACRFMGINAKGGNAHRFNDRAVHNLVNNRYEVRLENDDRPWYYTDKDIVSLGKYTFTVTHPDGKVERIFKVTEFIKRFKLWNLSVSANKLVDVAAQRYPELKFELDGDDGIIPVQMYNVQTKEVTEYPSIISCAKANGFNYSTVRRLTRQDKCTIYKGHAFRFKSEEPWVIDESKAPPKKSILAKHINGKFIEFPSERAAARYFDVDRSVLRTAAKNDKHYKNWKIKYN